MSSYHLRGDIVTDSKLVSSYEKDKEGYSKVPLGEFNAFNRMGDFYPADQAVPQLIGESRLTTTLKDGSLYGEVCHPPYDEFLKDGVDEKVALAKWLNRLSYVDTKLAAIHIKDIMIDVENGGDWRDESNKVRVWGWVKPWGPYAQLVEDSFNTPSMNTYFSLRSVVRPVPLGNGRPGRRMNMHEIYTFDLVTRGGYGSACKWKAAPGLEHFKSPDELDVRFKVEDMMRARDMAREMGAGRESEVMVDSMDRLIASMRRADASKSTRFAGGRSMDLWK